MWKKVSSKTIFEHPRITLVEDIVELPSGDQVPYLKYQSKNDSATIICVKGNEVLLQQEYSYPPNEKLFQFPGGKIKSGESPLVGIRRELIEEAGLTAGNIEELGWFYVDNRRTSAKMYVYLATDVQETTKIGGDKEEDITSHWTPIDQIAAMIASGEIRNYSLLSAWSLYTSTLLK